jgi:hypothetical protein
MANEKAPGMDRLPIELYRACSGLLAEVLHMWNHSLTVGHLFAGAANKKLCIVHKKRDKEDLKNYRPFTLMGSDYKIIAKTIAIRYQKIIHEILDPQQTGFIKGRQIRVNIIKAYLVTKYKERSNNRAVVLLDFEKAYDRVNRTWLLETLEKANVGPKSRRMVSTLHENSTVTLVINQSISSPIKVKGEVRQGCPLAPGLFAVSSEPLQECLNSESIKGITTLSITSKTGMYADDTTRYV